MYLLRKLYVRTLSTNLDCTACITILLVNIVNGYIRYIYLFTVSVIVTHACTSSHVSKILLSHMYDTNSIHCGVNSYIRYT